jgi:hypothetical protein
LNSLLTSYILCSIIDFRTRIHNNLHTMIDNTFINKFESENYSVYPLINGLSDHDAQVLSLLILLYQMTEMNFIPIGKLVNSH